MDTAKRGFTLLELLIVIAILAILASVTFVALNPAELLKKSRDSQRLADLASMRTAINYYIANTSSPVLGTNSTTGCQTNTTPSVYSHVSGVVALTTFTTSAATTAQGVDGTGWIKVPLTTLTGGSPLSRWPIDPNLTAANASPGRYYAYVCDNVDTTFELFANMESLTYSQNGSGDVENRDGGSMPGVYEIGTELGLVATTSGNFYNGGN